jgi:hypothetical protein
MGENQLTFEKFSTERCKILNHKRQLLGEIQRRRVGKFMHWVFCPYPIKNLGDMWITNGCMKEISEKISDLYKRGRME